MTESALDVLPDGGGPQRLEQALRARNRAGRALHYGSRDFIGFRLELLVLPPQIARFGADGHGLPQPLSVWVRGVVLRQVKNEIRLTCRGRADVMTSKSFG